MSARMYKIEGVIVMVTKMCMRTCQALQPSRQHKQERKLTSKAMNAKIGDRSIVPFNGGMIPLNRFRYGSQSVLQANNIL